MTGWRAREVSWPRDAILWVAMIVVAGRLDEFHHVMPALGIPDDYRYLPVMFEEAIELCLALFVALTVGVACRRALTRATRLSGGRAFRAAAGRG